MLKLILGRAGTGKSTAILNTMAAESKNRPQLLIVPEQHSHDAERKLCAVAGNSVSLHAEVLSFTRLASRVFSVSGGLAEPTLDAGGRLLLMDVALKGVGEQLKVYARPSRKPQFLSQLAATVDECKSAAITPLQLLEVSQALEGEEGDKFFDLSLILAAYDALCAQRGADPRDRLTKLAHALDACPWAEGKDIYIDSFTDFTAQERLVLERLLHQAHSVTVALTCDKLEGDEEDIFSSARRTANRLLELARSIRISCEVETRLTKPQEVAPGIARVEESLFDPVPTKRPGVPQGVELYRALTPYSEVERAAAELRRLCREEGYRCRELAVTARTMETYGPLIEEIFPRYGLPVFLSQMDDVLQKPILTLVTGALDTVAGGYRSEDVFRYLKTGLTDLTLDEVDRLENYVLKWELRGSAWTQKKAWDKHPEGYVTQWREGQRRQVEGLDALRRKVAEPLEELRQVREKTGRGLALALYRFLEKISLPQRLDARAGELRESGEAALAAEYEQLWDILCAALEQCDSLLGETPMEWEEFSRLFRLALSQYQVGAIPVSLDRITVGEMPRLAHRHCKVLYLLGADDGNIPAVSPSPGLLGDQDRALLAEFGLESAPQLTDKLWREMTIVYETLSLPRAAHCKLSFGWRGRGRETPCFPGEEAKRAFSRPDIQRRENSGRGFSVYRASLRFGTGRGKTVGSAGVEGAAGVCALGGADGEGGLSGARKFDPACGGDALWQSGSHVGLPPGQIPGLPFCVFYAVRVDRQAQKKGGICCRRLWYLCTLCAGAYPEGAEEGECSHTGTGQSCGGQVCGGAWGPGGGECPVPLSLCPVGKECFRRGEKCL